VSGSARCCSVTRRLGSSNYFYKKWHNGSATIGVWKYTAAFSVLTIQSYQPILQKTKNIGSCPE
jgi:hypothetical protein